MPCHCLNWSHSQIVPVMQIAGSMFLSMPACCHLRFSLLAHKAHIVRALKQQQCLKKPVANSSRCSSSRVTPIRFLQKPFENPPHCVQNQCSLCCSEYHTVLFTCKRQLVLRERGKQGSGSCTSVTQCKQAADIFTAQCNPKHLRLPHCTQPGIL